LGENNWETLVSCMEYVQKNNSGKCETIAKQTKDVKELQYAFAVNDFFATYGDYTGHCVRAHSNAKPIMQWGSFLYDLNGERTRFMRKYPNLNPESEEFAVKLYKRPLHAELLTYTGGRWSAAECELLFCFNDLRNAGAHRGINRSPLN
jgi:hypothetical protein